MNDVLRNSIYEYFSLLTAKDRDEIKKETGNIAEEVDIHYKFITDKLNYFYPLFDNQLYHEAVDRLKNLKFGQTSDIKEMDISLENFANRFIDSMRISNSHNNFEKLCNMIYFVTFDYPIRAVGALRTAANYNVNKDQDLGLLNMNPFYGKEKEYKDSVMNVLSREYDKSDIDHINETMHMMESLCKPWKLHSMRKILTMFFPRFIDYDDEEKAFIDVSDKVQYAPADDDTILESYDRDCIIGDIDFGKYGITESGKLITKIRIIPDEVPANVSYSPSFESVATLKSELDANISQFSYKEAGNFKFVTLMEYCDDLFVLYTDGSKSEDGYDLVKGYSLVKENGRDQKLFEYEIDKKEAPYIKAFNF